MRNLILAAVSVLMAGGAQAATLNVVGGELFGASGVDVGGTLYDVEFLDGSCITLFTGCDDASDFTFQSQAAAVLASQALLDQVFFEGTTFWDWLPASITGCSGPLSPASGCWTYTPYQLDGTADVYISVAVRSLITGMEGVGGGGVPIPLPIALDTIISSSDNYAVWSLVPEPSTALLMGLGLTGLSWSGRRRNRRHPRTLHRTPPRPRTRGHGCSEALAGLSVRPLPPPADDTLANGE